MCLRSTRLCKLKTTRSLTQRAFAAKSLPASTGVSNRPNQSSKAGSWDLLQTGSQALGHMFAGVARRERQWPQLQACAFPEMARSRSPTSLRWGLCMSCGHEFPCQCVPHSRIRVRLLRTPIQRLQIKSAWMSCDESRDVVCRAPGFPRAVPGCRDVLGPQMPEIPGEPPGARQVPVHERLYARPARPARPARAQAGHKHWILKS